ncbi:MAG: phosphoglycerate mutase family protein [Gaiellaceae bacterium MAG52_C11]|nr:phosphoglycerate mutase family protein [Candidatus Gaiellasilicea maunaloa]
MRRLVLVRHAEVRLDAELPPRRWELTDQGRADAERLARLAVFAAVEAVVSSPEPKAHATAEPIAAVAGVELRAERDLWEAERGASPVHDRAAFIARVDAWLGGSPVPCWEERDAASARIVACVSRLVDEVNGDVVVVSHGAVLSLYLAWLRGRERVELRDWEAIPLPAVAVVDPLARRILEPWQET